MYTVPKPECSLERSWHCVRGVGCISMEASRDFEGRASHCLLGEVTGASVRYRGAQHATCWHVGLWILVCRHVHG